MAFTAEDKVATSLVSAAGAAYIGYLAFGGVPFVRDVRGMAAVGARVRLRQSPDRRQRGVRSRVAAARVGAIACIALGFAALGTENGAVLALFMVSTVALWLAAMLVKSNVHFGRVRVSH